MTTIPVTVLTGFLGSGKTTLVNHILTAHHGHRIAVIENEFGEIPIDNDLVIGGDEKIIEMSNGCCLCCTARTDLIDILRSLLERRERFDRILIETSGMADPNPVAQTFFVDDEIARHFELDAIVTLVDAKHVGGHLDEVAPDGVGGQVVDQIAFADRIVVNKVDLVTPGELRVVEQRLRGINATAEMMTSTHGRIELSRILGVGAFDLNRELQNRPGWLDEPEHLHDPTLTSVGIEVDGEVDRAAFDDWLRRLVDGRGGDFYRFKGLIAVRDDDRRLVVQGIHQIYDVQPGAPWGSGPRRSRMVVIGRDLDKEELTRGLSSCASVRSLA
ncbi:CobW family GTP-binding protein [Pseudonocardia nigra]|uniref:CobW family GTP-binding protein n=1 Tax=Pseudonocardia nigra TaxID=1921578 RepID=UPI001C5DC331|nr:GTP-binding protein [Pseudonocardia nigra]